jgi:hypothetical protein
MIASLAFAASSSSRVVFILDIKRLSVNKKPP